MGQTDRVTGHTKTIALIGTPVEHSMSPAMHNTSFEAVGVDYIYLAYDVAEESQLQAAVEGMRVLGFAGCNVTMPYKTKVLQYLDELSDAAEIMGAVNTIVFKDGKAIGHNTDGAGFMRNIAEAGIDVKGKKMTIVGAGGAGSAIYTQAALDGVAQIDVFNRKDSFFDAADQRAKSVSERTGCEVRLLDLDDVEQLKASIAESALFVNATRVGMGDLADQCVISEDFLVDGLAVADTVYDPRETKLIKMAKDRGLTVAPGLGMLLRQAAIGEEIWADVQMPTDLIEEKYFN